MLVFLRHGLLSLMYEVLCIYNFGDPYNKSLKCIRIDSAFSINLLSCKGNGIVEIHKSIHVN